MSTMSLASRYIPLLALASVISFIIFYGALNGRESWRAIPQAVGLGDIQPNQKTTVSSGSAQNSTSESWRSQHDTDLTSPPKIDFRPGKAMPLGYNYTRLLVIPRTMEEDVSWIDENLPDLPKLVYV